MKTLILAALLCALLAQTSAEGFNYFDCLDDWDPINFRCFKYVPKAMTWADAQKNCRSYKANLAYVRDAKENGKIQEMIRQGKAAWIGSTDAQKEGCWSWVDGSTFTYANWAPGQPDNYQGNENCLQISTEGKQWSDVNCDQLLPSVCVRNY
ncbi:type-2 ice-structuring protein-like [Mastacembelus armatus]|uniref:Type-2 ice-structuring protein-like n=1 Tax=Mastacembelus armatus TaxID=205130 RepID=A0A7N8WN74_9TELE|nr:type-2 ice-structuring protein-like [Mastacembelus armatus]